MGAVTSIEYKKRIGVGNSGTSWESEWSSIDDLGPFTLNEDYYSAVGPKKVSGILFKINLDREVLDYVQVLYLLGLNCELRSWNDGPGTSLTSARIDQEVYRVDISQNENRAALPVASATATILAGDPDDYNTEHWTWRDSSTGLYSLNAVYVYLTCRGGTPYAAAIHFGNDPFSAANFDITYKAKAPGFDLTPTSIYTGSQIAISVYGRNNRTIRLRFTYLYVNAGNVIPITLDTVTLQQDTLSQTCPGTWFSTAAVTDTSIKTAVQLPVTVYADVLRDNGTWDQDSWHGSFTLKAGNDMKPTITVTEISCDNSGTPADDHYPNTFIHGISKAGIRLQVTSPVNSVISSVVCLCSNGETISLTYNSGLNVYYGFTAGTVVDNMTFTISAGDARGLIASTTTDPIVPVHYVAPTITVDENGTYRTDMSGAKTEGGICYKAKAYAVIDTNLPDNQVVLFTVKALNSQTTANITSGVQSGNISTSTAATARMTLTFTLKDYVGYTTTRTVYLDGNRVWIQIETPNDGDGINIGIGKKPENIVSGVSAIDLDVNFGGTPSRLGYLLEGMNALSFNALLDQSDDGSSFGKDFQNVDTGNVIAKKNATVYFSKPANTNTWSHFPPSRDTDTWRGIRMVFVYGSNKVLVMVIELMPQVGVLWFMHKSGTSWGSWLRTSSAYIPT